MLSNANLKLHKSTPVLCCVVHAQVGDKLNHDHPVHGQGSITPSTKKLEPGDMMHDQELVFENADAMTASIRVTNGCFWLAFKFDAWLITIGLLEHEPAVSRPRCSCSGRSSAGGGSSSC